MRIFRFDKEVGEAIEKFGSEGFVLSRILLIQGEARVRCAYLAPHGFIAEHPSVGEQLLAVVAGSGWVSGADGKQRAIAPGEAAYWVDGEVHETRTEDGLTAIIIEGERLKPGEIMPEVVE